MTDYTELKRAASASKNWGGEVGEGRWYASECFKRPYFSVQDAEFIAACDPGRVLALIAENEALRQVLAISHEFILNDARTRHMCDETGQVSPLFPKRVGILAAIDAAMGKGEQS